MYALLWDMDGVIADTETLNVRSSVAYYRDTFGVEMVADDFRPYVGRGAALYLGEPAKKYGLDIDLDKVIAERLEVFNTMLASSDCIALPGVHALAQAGADAADWKMAIATSSVINKSFFGLAMVWRCLTDPAVL